MSSETLKKCEKDSQGPPRHGKKKEMAVTPRLDVIIDHPYYPRFFQSHIFFLFSQWLPINNIHADGWIAETQFTEFN
jgi:hypothetical protein